MPEPSLVALIASANCSLLSHPLPFGRHMEGAEESRGLRKWPGPAAGHTRRVTIVGRTGGARGSCEALHCANEAE